MVTSDQINEQCVVLERLRAKLDAETRIMQSMVDDYENGVGVPDNGNLLVTSALNSATVCAVKNVGPDAKNNSREDKVVHFDIDVEDYPAVVTLKNVINSSGVTHKQVYEYYVKELNNNNVCGRTTGYNAIYSLKTGKGMRLNTYLTWCGILGASIFLDVNGKIYRAPIDIKETSEDKNGRE